MEEATESIGEHCDKAGITLIRPMDKLMRLERSLVTNGIIIELNSFVIGKQIKFPEFLAAIQKVYKLNNLAQGTLRTSIIRVKSDLAKLRKKPKEDLTRNNQLQNFYQTEFRPITKKRCLESTQAINNEDLLKEKNNLERQLEDMSAILPCKKAKIEELSIENRRLRVGYRQLQQKMKKKGTATASLRRLIDRKERSIRIWKGRAQAARKEKKAKIIIKRIYRSSKGKGVSKSVHKITTDSLKTSLNTVRELREERAALQVRVMELEDKVKEKEEETICTRAGGRRINPKLKAASMYLQNLGLAESNVSEAIKLVVEGVTESKLEGDMPSRSTQLRIASEMKALALKSVNESLSASTNITLKYDGTTDRRGSHVAEIELATDSATFLVGMRNQSGGSAEEYATTIKDAIADLDPSGKTMDKITNTMTDRHIVNSAVDKILDRDREEPLNKFRCAMHPLDSFQKSCNKVLADEKCGMANYPQMPYVHRGESMPQALLRCISKLFHQGDVNLGEDLKAYLRKEGFASEEKETLYPRWVGNKFNVLFRNARLVYLYAPHIVVFLTKVRKSQNLLAKSCLYMLEGGDCKMSFTCLGLIDKFITGPWMRIAGQDRPILEMNPLFHRAQTKIEQWISNPGELFQRNEVNSDCFGEDINEDAFIKDVWDRETSPECHRVIKLLLEAILAIINRQLVDQLPNGTFWEPSDELRKSSHSCSSTNISGERQFARMKALQHKAPAMKITKLEGKAMFSSNKTMAIMLNKTPEELAEDINWATKEGARVRKINQERERRYKDRVRERIEMHRREVSAKEQKARKEMENIVEDSLKYGYWTSEEDMRNAVRQLSKTKAKEAIRAQIKLRIKMLKEIVEGEKLRMTKATVEELEAHMLMLMLKSIPQESVKLEEVIKNPGSVVGKRIAQTFEDEAGKDKIWTGFIRQMVVNEHGQQEFEFVFDDSAGDPCYAQAEEIIVDIALGDLSLQ